MWKRFFTAMLISSVAMAQHGGKASEEALEPRAEKGVKDAEDALADEGPDFSTFLNEKSPYFEPLAGRFLAQVYKRYPDYKIDIEKAMKKMRVKFVDKLAEKGPEVKFLRGKLTVDQSRFNKNMDEVTHAKYLLGELFMAAWPGDAGYGTEWRNNANFNVLVTSDEERAARKK